MKKIKEIVILLRVFLVNIPYIHIYVYNLLLLMFVRNPPFLNNNMIKETKILEKNWKTIKKELYSVIDKDLPTY